MVEWSIAAFRAAGSVRSIVVAAPPGHVHELGGHDLGVVAGGATRAQSVANALEAVGTELVAIHDAARPLLTPELIEALVAALARGPRGRRRNRRHPGHRHDQGAPVAARRHLASKESGSSSSRRWTAAGSGRRRRLRSSGPRRCGRRSRSTPERRAAATDEAMLVEAAGGRVLIHPAPPQNLKVTTPLDLKVAEMLLAERAPA